MAEVASRSSHALSGEVSSTRAAWAQGPLGQVVEFLREVGEVTDLGVACVRAVASRRFEGREVVRQLDFMGVKSLGIVVVTSTFIGMVMALQFGFGLSMFGGMEYLGRVVGITFAREIAPTFTAVIVGSRIAAGIGAEIGAMAVTEQVDAIRALGADPIRKLVLPRLLAALVVLPVISVIALLVGFGGALFITDLEFGIPGSFFLASALDQAGLVDVAMGLIKTPFFGAIIALAGCHNGLRTRHGTAGVGRSTTRTVVTVVIAVMIANYLLTQTFIVLWDLLGG